jgi:hypothetical protein
MSFSGSLLSGAAFYGSEYYGSGLIVGGFSPASLFAAGEVGAWYDPSDLSTLYQDVAGTQPVTTPGERVALMLDKSRQTSFEGRRNLLTYSEQFDNAAWGKGNITIAANSATAPNGEVTADSYVLTAGTLVRELNRSPSAAVLSNSTAYTFSCYLKDGGDGSGWYEFTQASGVLGRSWFNPRTGTKGTGAGAITAVGSGWYRCDFPFTTGGSAASTVIYISARSADGGTGAETGAGDVGAYIWGAQLELGSTATAYQPVGASLPTAWTGNHATQATLAQRPTYAVEPATGRRNLLTYSEDVSNAVWAATAATKTATTITATATNNIHAAVHSFSHTTGQAYTFQCVLTYTNNQFVSLRILAGVFPHVCFDLVNGTVAGTQAGASGTITSLGGGAYLCTITVTATSTGTGNAGVFLQNTATTYGAGFLALGTESVGVSKAQLELGSTATAYQRVVTAQDVSEAGVAARPYLFFDGIDDNMLTGTITPGVDKAQVFAGVRKLRNTFEIIAEHSPNANDTADSGVFSCGFSTPNTTYFGARGNGATIRVGVGTNVPPVTLAVSGIGDISGDKATLRVNGAEIATDTADQGAGNFLAHTLYIGRRGNISAPLNGHIYGLIVRFSAANLADASIAATERWMNSKTGAF